MRIVIETVQHEDQRYDTVGDYWLDEEDGSIQIRVSDLGSWKYEALIAVHELVELLLCKARGIKFEDVDAFDFAFEGDGEPGEDLHAPYYEQHGCASQVERELAEWMDVDYAHYEQKLASLTWNGSNVQD